MLFWAVNDMKQLHKTKELLSDSCTTLSWLGSREQRWWTARTTQSPSTGEDRAGCSFREGSFPLMYALSCFGCSSSLQWPDWWRTPALWFETGTRQCRGGKKWEWDERERSWEPSWTTSSSCVGRAEAELTSTFSPDSSSHEPQKLLEGYVLPKAIGIHNATSPSTSSLCWLHSKT